MRDLLLITLCITLCSCSDSGESPSSSTSSADAKKVMAQHEALTQKGILADFVALLTDNKFDQAILLLHPKLAEAWTTDRFTKDWQMIKKQLPSGWKPEATGSFAGQSPQGPFKQASYRLDSNWRSLASLEITSMKMDGKENIVRIHIRMPETMKPPASVASQTDAFLQAMSKKEYAKVQDLFSETSRAQYSAGVLGQIGTFLGDSPENVSRTYYRFCANTVWYDAVQLKKQNAPASYLELIMQTDMVKTEIVSLNFKGRMQIPGQNDTGVHAPNH